MSDRETPGPDVAPKRSELWLRVASALVLLAIVLPLIWIGHWPFWAMCLALSLVLAYEWYRIVVGKGLGGAALAGWLVLGVIYAAIPFLTLPVIRAVQSPSGLLLLAVLFFAVWASDIGAYFAGRHFGGPKLAPHISPNKTWSGAVGGLMSAVMITVLIGAVFSSFAFWLCVIGGAVLSIFSQAGDLFESWMKRRFGVKDSSNLIPGHGGFMDRVDGLVAAALPMSVYVSLTAIGGGG